MALHKTKPTSPGRRFQVSVVNNDLHKGGPWEPLLAKKNRSGGRNSAGRITVRHRGGGTSSAIELLISNATKMAYLRQLNALNMTPIVLPTLHC